MTLLARDIMQADVLCASPSMSVLELSDFLIEHRISGVPVVEHDQLVGIVSRSDIVRAASLDRTLAGLAAEGVEQIEFAPNEAPEPLALLRNAARAVELQKVRDIMVVEPVVVAPDTPIKDVAAVLTGRHLHRVIVTEGKHVRGVISTLDLVRLVADGRVTER